MHWKTRDLNRDRRAQASIFDAFMFFIIMLIASTLVFVFSTQAMQTQEVIGREGMMRFTDESMQALLQSTVHEAWYHDNHGNKITKPPGSTNINDLIFEELALLDDGIPRENFTQGYEKPIKSNLEKLVGLRYDYALHAVYKNNANGQINEIFISNVDSLNDIPEKDVTTSQLISPMVIDGKSGDVVITLSIWRSNIG